MVSGSPRHFLLHPRLLLVFSCILVAQLFGATPAAPNVLLIVSDDQGWPDLGSMKLKDIQTPNLDRIAAEGVRASQFYVAWSSCTPSRRGDY